MRNTEISAAEIVDFIACVEKELGWQEAVRLLSKRGRFTLEMRCHLEGAGCSPPSIDSVLAKCHRLGYLDDTKRAKHMIEGWKKKGYGLRKIQLELKKRAGIFFLEKESDFSSDYPSRYIDRHLHVSATKKERAKVIRALLRRGFSLEAIYSALSGKKV